MAGKETNISKILRVIGQQIKTCATGKLAYSEPVAYADRIIIPVAWVRYDFGGGGGADGFAQTANQGGGAGGQVSIAPAGVIEMTPTSTRFLPFPANKEVFALIASSFGNQSGMNTQGSLREGNQPPTIENPRSPKSELAAKKGTGQSRTGKKAATKRFRAPGKKAAAVRKVSVRTAKKSSPPTLIVD
jgi:uncharacterized spore protein YtfJ